MTHIEYLKSIGHTDAEITAMAAAFGGPEKLAKAFETPIRNLEAAQTEAAAAKKDKEDNLAWYNDEILPKMSSVYQDAINTRTKNAALEERLKAATEYGFLGDEKVVAGVVPGASGGTPVVVNTVPGSPSGTPTPMDTRYVAADKFTEAVNNIPDMLGRLTKMSNEHFSLFGSPLLDVDTLITEARNQKKNVITIWEQKYKVPEKRAEIQLKAQQDHDRTIGEEAVRKYASEHGQPFMAPGRTSVASHFTPGASAEARQPWKGAKERQSERRQKLLTEFQKTGTSSSSARPN